MHCLKKSIYKKKGLIVITHKEYPEIKKLKGFNTLVRNNYLILHIGFNIKIPFKWFLPQSKIDLFLIPEFSKTPFWIKRLDFCSRRFTPDFFLENPGDYRPIDLIYVGRISPFKKSLEIANFAKNLDLKTLFIGFCKENNKEYYEKFLSVISDKENIKFLDGTGKRSKDFWGIDQEEISNYLKKSKIYIHGSLNEGESRTIHEAFLAGCILMVNKNMKGGGLDYYNKMNYELYDYKDIQNPLFKALEKAKYSKNLPSNHYDLLNKNSVKIFKNKLESIFIDIDMSEEGWDFEKLNLKLPSHYLNVPWYREGMATADIITSDQLNIFLSQNSIF